MQNVTAILSMLHEPVSPNSATRLFRGEPVLSWTLRRLTRAERLGNVAVLCWEDQVPTVEEVCEEHHAFVLAKGPRHTIAQLESISAARRWSDGWRGGLLSTCDFDRGFHGPWVRELSERVGADAVVLIDPSSAMVDPELIDSLIAHAEAHGDVELGFVHAAPGLSGPLVRLPLLDKLATAAAHPGRLLHYNPDTPTRDPIGTDACLRAAASVARSPFNYRLDSRRQIVRVSRASAPLNGTLAATSAEQIVQQFQWSRDEVDELPRELSIELNTGRSCAPLFWPGRQRPIAREPIPAIAWGVVFEQFSTFADDTRLTIGGIGDPLECDQLFAVIDLARAAGIEAIHVQTDLLADPQRVERLAAAEVDVISVNLPAVTAESYAALMGVDGYQRVLENIARVVQLRHARGRGVPLVVPVFTKCHRNLAEMEAWYDLWLRTLGNAVIEGPSDHAGQYPEIGNLAVADMSPGSRWPCVRLNRRMSVLCDGTVVACDQDVLGLRPVGLIGERPVRELWTELLEPLRSDHALGRAGQRPLCGSCREWHRAA